MTVAFRARRKARRAGDDVFVHHVTIRLDHRQDLFSPPALDEFGGSANLVSGIEQLVEDLVAAWPLGRIHVTVELPPDEITADTGPGMKESIERYCDRRLADLESQRVALRQEGFSALVLSVPLLAVALLLTAAVSESGLPSFWRSFLGDGVLLVLAWVALWYPLDTLVWYGRPLAHEIRMLHGLRDHLHLEVRPATGPA
jgi:hypothetical protein